VNGFLQTSTIEARDVIADLLQLTDSGLADEFQNTLAPKVAFRDQRVEAFGRTVPRERAGGDLLDLVTDGRDVVAYVADASGHGLRAAVLVGMLKTAVRYGLLLGQPLPALLNVMNRVLPAVKESSMFATFAGLRFDGSGSVEYATAGHVPLLRYRRRHGDVVRCTVPEFPLGLFEDARYASTRIPYSPGDVFALVTDGVVETADDHGVEFGLERLERVLCEHAESPLAEIYGAALEAATLHGAQHDDRTLLLLRTLA
jgi:serine phosphatase RsbU (regulator of sigma subunit)